MGDVRGYVANAHDMTQITTDHSLVAGQTTVMSEGASGVGRNIVTRGIGFPFPEDPEFHQLPIKPATQILLCSDGLWGMLDDDEMALLLSQSASPEEACDTLVDAANEAGGKDNITAVVISTL